MTTAELAKAFTDLLKQGDHEGAAAKYNAEDIVSYEAMEGPMAVCSGKEAVKQKGDWWFANHEVHGGSVEGPYVNGDQFAVRFTMDITRKETGEPVKMDEVGLYTVKESASTISATQEIPQALAGVARPSAVRRRAPAVRRSAPSR